MSVTVTLLLPHCYCVQIQRTFTLISRTVSVSIQLTVMYRQTQAYFLLSIICSSAILSVHAQFHRQSSYRDPLYRKFVSKPNNIKKQSLYYGQDLQKPIDKNDYGYNAVLTNSLVGGPGSGSLANSANSFNWSKLLNMGLQFVMGAAQAFTSGTQIDKIDNSDGFSWAKAISIGMQVLLNVLGGGSDSQIEKNDDPSKSAMQGVIATVLGLAMGDSDPASVQIMAKQATELFGVIMSLMDALKTSFSERSLHARSLGDSDYMAETGITAITMLEGVGRNYLLEDADCSRKSMCLAAKECVERASRGAYVCQLGGFIASYLSPHDSVTLRDLTTATQHGQSGHDCALLYSSCNLI